MSRCLWFLLFVLFLISVGGQQVGNYTLWSEILDQTIVAGQIDNISLNTFNYNLLNSSLLQQFQQFLDQLNRTDLSTINQTRTQFFAFYINAYNALAVSTIIKHPCNSDPFGDCGGNLTSINNAGNTFHKVWNKPAGDLGGKTWTLQQIEDLLRKQVPGNPYPLDPRIHSCIVCASVSCPNLMKGAYEPAILDEQMQNQMGEFLTNPGKGMRVNMTENTVELSRIFDWYSSDFENVSGSVLNFITNGGFPYIPNATINYLKNNKNNVSISYFTYNWNVNGYWDDPSCSNRPCYPWWALLITIIGIILVLVMIVVLVFVLRKRREQNYSRIE